MTFTSGIADGLDPMRLRLLVEVGRRGSVSGAADACGVSQPSASKHLKTVETALGERLVERDGRASRLTPAGEVVAAHALRMLDELDAMGEQLRALRDAERGTLALAASTTPGTYVLPTILRCFADRHPGVEVEVVIGPSAWVAERVAHRDVSLGLAGEIDLPAEVVAEPFLNDEVIGICAPGALRVAGGRASLRELASHTLLIREPGSSTRLVADRYLGRVGYRPARRWELDSNEAIKRAVRAGLGVAFVSRLVVAEELERGELEELHVRGADPMSRTVQLLRPASRELTPSEHAFVQTLCSCCGASVAGCTATVTQAAPRSG
ncbi:MAG: LysR substrate-binding domain-containing protein [Solirubrobacterales bacterium]